MSSLFRSTGKGGIKRVNTMSRTLTDVHCFKEGVSHALTTYPVELLISPGSEQHENYRTPSIPLKHRALTSNAKEPHPFGCSDTRHPMQKTSLTGTHIACLQMEVPNQRSTRTVDVSRYFARRRIPLGIVCGFACIIGSFTSDSALGCDRLPAGQSLWVRLSSPVSTYTAQVDDPVYAVLIQDVVCDSDVVLAMGTPIEGHVRSKRKGGW